MSELIDNSRKRQELLKHLILQLHNGEAPAAVKKQLIRLLGEVPYGDVVKVEQELISEGLPSEEVLKLCDVHAEALKGTIDLSGAKKAAPGHPVYTFQKENIELKSRIETLGTVITEIHQMADEADSTPPMMKVRELFNELQDVEKHYLRKEHLLFPYLEKKGITGPPKVMWGKHDEARQLMKAAQEGFEGFEHIEAGEARALIEFIIQPAISAIDDMIYKEEQILFPMCLDTLNDIEWNEINQQSPELGFCLYVPEVTWEIENGETVQQESKSNGSILFHTGKMEVNELIAIFEAMPVDLTFVDKDDFVRFFSHGAGRIFERTLSVIGRKVQFCHPPSSVHIVQRILDDFRNDRQNKATFWINLHGKFIHIEYIALRGSKGEYLGTLEVTQDLTEKRELEGDRRLLEYEVED